MIVECRFINGRTICSNKVTMKTYKIFTLKLKKYLESLGFECIGKEKSWKDPNYSVFLFPYTDEIDSAVSEYLKK